MIGFDKGKSRLRGDGSWALALSVQYNASIGELVGEGISWRGGERVLLCWRRRKRRRRLGLQGTFGDNWTGHGLGGEKRLFTSGRMLPSPSHKVTSS